MRACVRVCVCFFDVDRLQTPVGIVGIEPHSMSLITTFGYRSRTLPTSQSDPGIRLLWRLGFPRSFDFKNKTNQI